MHAPAINMPMYECQTTIMDVHNNRYRSIRQVCPRCHHGWTGEIPSAIMRLRKVCYAVCAECTVPHIYM